MELNDLIFIPRYLGEPMYPGGMPVRPTSHYFENKSAHDLYFQDEELTEMQLRFMAEYCVYYIHGPLWEFDNPAAVEELCKRMLFAKTMEELGDVLYDLLEETGIDIF